MRFKLDENLGLMVAGQLRTAGHDVVTVSEEQLQGAADRLVLDAAHGEARCLVTLDVEFGNPLVFRPSDFSGIVLIRLPARPTPKNITAAITSLMQAAANASVLGKLWIVQAGRVRQYEPEQ